MKPKQINDKWCIEAYTEEFGNILILEKCSINAIEFNTELEALNYIELKKRFICIQNCGELDMDDMGHCIDTEENIREKEDRRGDYCPCGNIAVWKEIVQIGDELI